MVNNSKNGAEDYARWIGLKEDEKIKVLYNGCFLSWKSFSASVPENFRESVGIPVNAPVVGSVFRFYEEKRPFFWLDTAKEIIKKKPETWFLLVGDGVLKKKAQKKAARIGLGERIVFTGLLKNPLPAIGAMDVFLLTSRKEGLPNVLIEAQSLGIPVVASDVGGAAETIISGVTGYAVKDPTPESMALEVLKVFNNPVWRENAEKHALEFVEKKFILSECLIIR
jgi:glycosyltransferase involved in cell wall biosynthesis